jgi:hypothetical protein
MSKVAGRPKPIMRYFVAGAEVDPEGFWKAVQALGGRAVVETVDPAEMPERRARLTPLGEVAVRGGWR